MMRVADYIMERLNEAAANHLFMVTGRGMLFLSDAAARHEGIHEICMHHEQACAYAAMAYAQAHEKLGACMVSTGCASTNAITGVLCAWQDDVPMIVISGQNKLKETTHHTHLPIKTYGQQEADVIAMVKPITKHAVMLQCAQDVAYEMDKALHLAQHGRKGPVWVDIPLDIQNMRIEPSELRRYTPEEAPLPAPTTADISALKAALEKAERPMVLIGSGIRSSGSIDALINFVETYQMPVVYGHAAVDVLPTAHPLSIGCAGSMAANRAANFAIQNADFILVLGNRLGTYIMGEQIDKFARAASIMAVDITPAEHQKFPGKVNHTIHADLAAFFTSISNETLPHTPASWVHHCQKWKADFPKCEARYKGAELVDIYELAETLSTSIADDTIMVTDSGLEEILTPTTMDFTANQRCLHPPSQGAMGYALPAAIGAHYAAHKPVVTVVGDGSVMMNIQELQTVAHHQLPLKIIIVNNNCYAVIRRRQKDLFRTRIVGVNKDNGVSCPDYEKVATAFEIPYARINTTPEMHEKLATLMATQGPLIVEVMAKDDQCYIHSSYRKGANKRLVQPPIEDQSPFLEREDFLANMIIDPIDL